MIIAGKTRRRAALCIWLLLGASSAFAQSSVSMGDITSAANRSGDKSMSLLQLVYGSIVQNPLASGGGSSGGMIAQMFLTLNACFLAVGVIWAMYHFGSAMLSTAQDGEFLGQKKSSAWFLIRMGAGFTGLVPIFGGFCGAQVIMLWGTMMGVGIANLTLTAAVTALQSGGSMVATPVSPQATSLAKALFEANLCMAGANQAISDMPADSGVSVSGTETFSAISTGSKVVLMNQNGLSCGGAEIDVTAPHTMASATGLASYATDSTSALYSQMLSAHQSALSAMQSSLSSQASQYVSAVDGGTSPQDASGIIDAAAKQYEASITQAIASSSSTINALSSMIASNLQRDGWIMMGAWYQTFAQANAQNTSMANATATGVPGTEANNLPYPQLYRTVLSVYAQQNQKDASTSTSPTLASNLTTGMTDPKNVMSKIFPGQSLVKFFISFNANQGPNGMTNPLIGMKNLGDYILDAGWTALGAYAFIKAINGASNSTLGSVLTGVADVATAGVAGASKGAAQGVLEAVTPFVVMMVITLFFFGAMLSIYIPMLPFIIWFGGVVSWFAVVGESQIAAPLWAMTHLDGDGEGMGQRSTHGYIFLLNVMFRPVFMMIGFVLGGAGVVVLGTLLNTMFGVAMQNAQYDSVTGLVSVVGFLVLYVGMCQTLCNACFGLINVVPDQVFAWIGGQMAGRVGADMADTSKRNLDAGTSQGSGQGKSAIAGVIGRDKPAAEGPRVLAEGDYKA